MKELFINRRVLFKETIKPVIYLSIVDDYLLIGFADELLQPSLDFDQPINTINVYYDLI